MPEIKFAKHLSQAPVKETPIFRLAAPAVSESQLKGLAGRLGFGLKSGILQQETDSLTYVEGPLTLKQYKASGGFRFQDRSRFQIDDGHSAVLFSDKEAVARAEELVKKLELAPAKEYQLLKVTHLYVGGVELKTGEAEKERAIDVAVVFRRVVNGLPVDGPGGILAICLDPKGDLVAMDRIWRTLGVVYRPAEKIRAPQVAEEGLIKFLQSQDQDGYKVEVEDVRFGYWEMGWKTAQRFLQPAYVMPLKLTSPDEQFASKTVYVTEAAVNPVGVLMPAKKPRPPEPERKK